MLFHLLIYLRDTVPWLSWLNVFRYTSTRIIAATMTALLLSFLLGPWFIRKLQEKQIGQEVRDDGPKTHLAKRGTPTMGGSLILFSLIMPTLLWCDLRNRFLWLVLAVTAGYGVIGFIDDYLKVSRRNPKGLAGKIKLLAQFGIAAAVLIYLFYGNLFDDHIRLRLGLPLLNFNQTTLLLPAPLYVLFALVVVVGASNAVNLTDGLDGLAIGPIIISAGTFLILTYLAGTVLRGFNVAHYLNIAYIAGVGELAIYCGAMLGAGVGFLWYNTHPASVFMGDVGALALGGGLGMLAVLTKNEFTLCLVGGIFVVEALSVIVQVVSFRLFGKRVFRMAPIHHHFELKGWAEPKTVVRFWIISGMLALIALATLKVR